MGHNDAADGDGADEGLVKGRKSSGSSRRKSSTATGGTGGAGGGGGWRKFLCCLKPVDDEIQQLDFRHCSLNDVPAQVFNHERTLEVLYLDCNQITDLPRPLFHCHGLEQLWLSDNEISQLPHALASLINLKVSQLLLLRDRNYNIPIFFHEQ